MELHLRAEARFKENNEFDHLQPSPFTPKKMVIKRVSVDKKTREFSEEKERTSLEGDDFPGGMGKVRKYVKNLKQQQIDLRNQMMGP